MSFVTFLWKGPFHPAFAQLQENYLLQNIPITRHPNGNFSFDFSAYDKAKAMWNRFSKLSYASGLACASLSIGLVGWTGWKVVSTRSLFQTTHLACLVGAVFFACIIPRAYTAVKTLNSSFHFIESHKLSSTYQNNINYFRMGVLQDNNFLTERLSSELINRVSELFSEEEKEQLFRNLFNFHPEKIDSFSPLLSPNTPLSNLVQSYQTFKDSLNFQQLQREGQRLFHKWVKQKMLPSINSSLNTSVDQKLVALFKTCYTKEMGSPWVTTQMDCDFALRTVRELMAEKEIVDAAHYLKNEAPADFENLLYLSGYGKRWSRITQAMISENLDASDWLKTNFER